MIAEADLAHCREAIRTGSLSFHAASKLLPQRVRDPALALYAFCRLADDAVDEGDEKAGAVLSLRDRLDRAYRNEPRDAPADRAFAALIRDVGMPRALPEALLEGLAWDAEERRCETYSDLLSYSARVASAVGVMMCVIMGVRDAKALARASDMGLAMQLTNIARDVGEDARAGRLYLPLEWLDEVGVKPEAFLADPHPTDDIRMLTRRLLRRADEFYLRGGAGVRELPLDCRPGIYAAGRVYAGIGSQIKRARYDSVTRRARTGKAQKALWLAMSGIRAGISTVTPRSALLHAKPTAEIAFLVDAAASAEPASATWGEARAAALIDVLTHLEAQDRHRREGLIHRNREVI